jgi:hypothetical protein
MLAKYVRCRRCRWGRRGFRCVEAQARWTVFDEVLGEAKMELEVMVQLQIG